MSETLRKFPVERKRRFTQTPQRNPIAADLGVLLGMEERTAERAIHNARKVVDRIVEASRMASRPDYVTTFFSHADAARKIDGAPLTFDNAMACLVSRDVLAEAQSLTECVANMTPAHRATLLTRSVKLLAEVSELIVALKAAP